MILARAEVLPQDYVVAVVIALLVLGVGLLMVRSLRRRGRDQAGLVGPLATTPADPGEIVLGPLTGVYVGSTRSGLRQDKIMVPPLGPRASGELVAHTGGLVLRIGDDEVWIPRAQLVDVRQDSRLANKVVPGGGLLVVRWHAHGDSGATEIDSGFRADDKDTYPRWAALRGDAPALTPADTLGLQEKS